MFCPDCGAELRDGADECIECEIGSYVTVLETSEVSVIPVLKTVLEGAGIPFRTRGEGLMGLFPSEALGAPLHSSAGEVRILVAADRAEEARALLSTAATVEGDTGEGEPGDGP